MPLQLHGGLCKTLSIRYCKVLAIFPELEAARPRSKSGIQALCSLHVALEKAKNVLQHCSECSKLYLVCFLSSPFIRIQFALHHSMKFESLLMQAITGDSVLLKFKKTRSALVSSLKGVEDIVPQSIGCQVNHEKKKLCDFLLYSANNLMCIIY